MLKKLVLAVLLGVGSSIVYIAPPAHATADYSIDCDVDPNGASTDFEIQNVYLTPGETIQIEALGCDAVCGEGSNVDDGGFCGTYSFPGGDFTATFTNFGYFSGRTSGDAVVYWFNVLADPVDIDLSATAGDGSLDFTWNSVPSATAYAVALDDFTQICFVTAPNPNTCSFTGLTNDQAYNFKIRVRYPWGGGTDFWYPSSAFTPSAPTTTTESTTTTTTTTTLASTTTLAPTTTDPDEPTTTTEDSIATEISAEDTLVPTGSTTGSSTWFGLILIALGLTAIVFRQRKTY